MWKFLAGALVVFLYYNQANCIRVYKIVIRELNRMENISDVKHLDGGVAPKIKTDVEVNEPTLNQMESLGFRVKRSE